MDQRPTQQEGNYAWMETYPIYEDIEIIALEGEHTTTILLNQHNF